MGKRTWLVIRFYQIWSFFLLLFCLSDQPLLSVFPALCPSSSLTVSEPGSHRNLRATPGGPSHSPGSRVSCLCPPLALEAWLSLLLKTCPDLPAKYVVAPRPPFLGEAAASVPRTASLWGSVSCPRVRGAQAFNLAAYSHLRFSCCETGPAGFPEIIPGKRLSLVLST